MRLWYINAYWHKISKMGGLPTVKGWGITAKTIYYYTILVHVNFLFLLIFIPPQVAILLGLINIYQQKDNRTIYLFLVFLFILSTFLAHLLQYFIGLVFPLIILFLQHSQAIYFLLFLYSS